jgi:hypothetical protein
MSIRVQWYIIAALAVWCAFQQYAISVNGSAVRTLLDWAHDELSDGGAIYQVASHHTRTR